MSFRSSVIAVVATVALAGNAREHGYYEAKFFDWLQKFDIKPTSGEHFVKMLQNFANNDDIIEAHNSKPNMTYTLGHNHFSHLSLDEWRVHVRLGLARPTETEDPIAILAPADVSTLADDVDWSAAGAVTDVKDQGQCGSCWSFSATGAMEGGYFRKYGQLPGAYSSKTGFNGLSEQNLVDCDNRHNGGTDMGCNGGLMDSAFSWAKKNGGLCSEADYPYFSGDTKAGGTCVTTCAKSAAPVGYTDVTKNSDAALMTALNQQPVSVAIEADQSSFQLYKSGVFTGTCGTNLDHGVLAVGYGSLDGVDYYKVKNSWSSSWGLGGYILIARNVQQSGGQCGILNGPPSFPNY